MIAAKASKAKSNTCVFHAWALMPWFRTGCGVEVEAEVEVEVEVDVEVDVPLLGSLLVMEDTVLSVDEDPLDSVVGLDSMAELGVVVGTDELDLEVDVIWLDPVVGELFDVVELVVLDLDGVVELEDMELVVVVL